VNGTLKIEVTDDGPGFAAAERSESRGIGLANTRARLHQLYGDAAKVTIGNGEAGGAVVTLTLPYHMVAGDSETELLEVHAPENSDRG
jgi:sensor histidine kinase YesM